MGGGKSLVHIRVGKGVVSENEFRAPKSNHSVVPVCWNNQNVVTQGPSTRRALADLLVIKAPKFACLFIASRDAVAGELLELNCEPMLVGDSNCPYLTTKQRNFSRLKKR